MTPTTGEHPPAGWYPDPHDRAQDRYWDGNAWTEHRQPSSAGSSSPEDTAVLPRTEQVSTAAPAVTTASARNTGRSSYGWVSALVGLLVGLVVGVTAGVVVANSNDSSTPQSGSTSGPPTSTVTATSTATATVTESVTSTATETATATVTVTAPPSS